MKNTLLSTLFGLTLVVTGCSPPHPIGITCGGSDVLCPQGMICEDGICVTNRNLPAPVVDDTCAKDTDCKGDRICTAGVCTDPAAKPTEHTVKLEAALVDETEAAFIVTTSVGFVSYTLTVTDVTNVNVSNQGNATPADSWTLSATGLKPGEMYLATIEVSWQNGAVTASDRVVFTTKSLLGVAKFESASVKVDSYDQMMASFSFHYTLTGPGRIYLSYKLNLQDPTWNIVLVNGPNQIGPNATTMNMSRPGNFGPNDVYSVWFLLQVRDNNDVTTDSVILLANVGF